MKITFLCEEWTSSTKGGTSTLFRELAMQLAKLSDVEVSVLLPQCSKEDQINAASQDVQLVVAEMLPDMNPVDCLMVIPDRHIMDCVVVHGKTLGKRAQFSRKLHPCKWIQVVHTAPEELGMYKSISHGKQLQKTKVALCEKADQVVAIGPKLADTYKHFLCHSKKDQFVFDLTPGILSEFLNVELATEERRSFHILGSGSGDCCEDFMLKGFELAAQAIAELKDKSYQLKFVGAPRGKGDEIADKLAQNGIDCSQLLVCSFSDSREVLATLFCEVDLVITPPKSEGFGIIALQALSAGLPVLVSSNSGLGEALKEVPFGLSCVIDSEDPKDWAREIKGVRQKSRKVRLAESRFLREMYRKTYHWEEPTARLVERMYNLTIALKGSSDCYSHSFMEYGQSPLPTTSLNQDRCLQQRVSRSRPVIATGDKRPASTVFGDHHSKQIREVINSGFYEVLKGSSVGHLSHSLMEYGQCPLLPATLTQEEPVQQRTRTQEQLKPLKKTEESVITAQCPQDLNFAEQMKPLTKSEEPDMTAQFSQSSKLADYPEQLVELIRREYKSAVLCPFPWCEEELQFELSKIFTRPMIVPREKERKSLPDRHVKMTEVFRALKKCDCKCKCQCEGKKPRVVLIEGSPGIGKTTYCQKIAYDWSLGNITTESSFPKVDMLLRLTCRDMKNANIEDAIDNQLLPINVDEKDRERFFHFIRHNQTRTLLILDGLNELPKNLFEELLPLITGRVFPQTYLMLTARHNVGMKVRRHCDALFEIVGYTKGDADNYILNYFSNHENTEIAKRLIGTIDQDPQLRELTASALNTALLCLVCEDTDGVLPHSTTLLYCKLVSCVLRRYCSKKGISLDYQDPIEKYADQLNQLGELALEALLKDQLAFTLKELKSQSTEFLELGFLSRETITSKFGLKPTYVFLHKTFQEYFAAFHLAHELLTTNRDKAALLAQLTPVDKYWQVWGFLITMAASKSDDTAALWVSSICTAFQHQKPDQFSNHPYAQQAKDRGDKWSKSDGNSPFTKRALPQSRWGDENYHKGNTEDETTMSFCLNVSAQKEDSNDNSSRRRSDEDKDVCRDAKYTWEGLNRRPFRVNRKFSFVVKIVEAIAQCEHPNTELKPYQIKMAGTLARYFPMDEVKVKSSYDRITLNSRFPFVFSKFLNGNCKLIKLTWELDVSASEALIDVLQTSHTLTHLDLTNGTCIKSITPALQVNHTVTHLGMRKAGVGDVEAKALGTVLQSNHTLTHLCLDDNKITPVGIEALAEALKSNEVLENLNIGNNHIGDSGAVALSQVLESNGTLRCLNVGGGLSLKLIKLGDRGVRAIARALRYNSSLTYLDISGHFAPKSALSALGEALQSNCSLTHLYLKKEKISFTRSHFGNSAAVAFSKALRSRDTQLTHLDLQCSTFSSSCVIILAEGLGANGTLERLDLSQNHIDCPGAVALAQALKKNQTLTHLQLKDNRIGDAGAKEFAEVLQCNKTLMFLGLLDNQMTESGIDLFAVLQSGRLTVIGAGVKWIRN